MTESESDSDHVCTALKTCGWNIVVYDSAKDVSSTIVPALLVFDLPRGTEHLDPSKGWSKAQWAASVPRVAFGISGGQGFDLVLDRALPEARIAEIIADWRPPESLEALDRIANTLGTAAVAPIVTGLRTELGKAVAELDDGRSDMAHRIAGLAGTLGFQTVSTVWNALSHGDWSLAPAARREARVAMASIDRWLITAERG